MRTEGWVEEVKSAEMCGAEVDEGQANSLMSTQQPVTGMARW